MTTPPTTPVRDALRAVVRGVVLGVLLFAVTLVAAEALQDEYAKATFHLVCLTLFVQTIGRRA